MRGNLTIRKIKRSSPNHFLSSSFYLSVTYCLTVIMKTFLNFRFFAAALLSQFDTLWLQFFTEHDKNQLNYFTVHNCVDLTGKRGCYTLVKCIVYWYLNLPTSNQFNEWIISQCLCLVPNNVCFPSNLITDDAFRIAGN